MRQAEIVLLDFFRAAEQPRAQTAGQSRLADAFRPGEQQGLRDAILLLLRVTHNLAEGAGAASTAAAFQVREQLAGKTVVGVLSGGNLDLRELARILACP